MNKTSACLFVMPLCFAFSQTLASGSTIWLDADPTGNGKTTNILGATYNSVSGTVTNWGSYRDYRFELIASPQATTLADFGLRLSVNKSSSFSAPLNVTWFADSITPYAANPDYTTALGTIGASDLPTGAFVTYVIGPGPYKAPVTVPSTITAYWVRLWAATSGGNDKYQTKLADNINLEYVSTASNITMYNYNETTSQYTTTAATQTTNITPVPEPSTIVLAVVAAGGACIQRRRRRTC